MATRTELVKTVGERYRSADRGSKGHILDEFVAVTGFHRKHAMRLLRAGRPVTVAGVRLERRVYDEAARTALIVLWEAADRLLVFGSSFKAQNSRFSNSQPGTV